MKVSILGLVVALVLVIPFEPVVADSDEGRLEALEGRIETLLRRVEALEAARSFASFMPNFSERFHVMHRAGEAGDWAVASHELAEIQRLSRLSVSINPERGELMEQMMRPSFEALEEAIEHGNETKFQAALVQTVTTCNACHVATGSEFIEVKLDARDSLSIRHPHRFMHREMPGGHDHGMSSGMGSMMQPSQPEGGAHGHGTESTEHGHGTESGEHQN